MVSFEANARYRELSVQLKGAVTVDDLNAAQTAFENELDRMRPGFVLLVDYAELQAFEPVAQGVVFYFVRRVFEANPRAILVVNGPDRAVSRVIPRAMHAFVKDLGLKDLDLERKVRRFPSRARAEAFLGACRMQRVA